MSVLMPDKVSVRGPARFVQGDTRTQIVTFTVPRYSDGVDLSKLGWSIHIKNAAGTKWFEAPAENPDVRSDKITIKWLVRGDTTKTAGDLTFSLRGAGNDAAGNAMRWCSGDEIRPVCAAQESSSTSNNETAVTAVELLLQMVQTELPAVIAAKEDTIKATASANAAAALADAAAKNAASAATAATTARDAANTAAARASSAAESVEAVVINANDAADEASAAAVDANEAKAAADAAAGSANAAAGRLEEGLSAVREALSAMIKAEDNRVAAETQRVGKENLRDNAETRRANAETKREEAESNRIATFAEAHAASVAATSAANQAAESARGAAEAAYSVANLAADPLVLVEKSQPACIWPEAGKLLHPVISMLPMQSGSGVPSPDNVRPISGRTSVAVTRCGKNLFDKNNYTPLALYINPDTKTYFNYGDKRTVVIAIAPNTTYAVKKSTSTVMRVATSANYPANGVSTTSFVSHGNSNSTDALIITSGTNDAYLAVQLFTNSSEGTDDYSIEANIGDLQVEVGSTATDYEPYQGETFTIALGDTIYGGVLDAAKGELTVTHKLIAAANIGWKATATAGLFNSGSAPKAGTTPLCNVLPCKSGAWTSSVGEWVIFNNQGSQWVIRTDLTSPDELTAWFAEHDAKVCYELKKPVAVQLSPALISALEGLNTVTSSGEGMELTYNKSLMREREELLVRISALEAALLNNV